jgi:hypothetical protein
MVVDYHHLGSERREPFVGVFHAPPDLNTYLRLSEPKEHHRWDANTRRLQQKPFGTDVVASLHRRCSGAARDFQASLAPKKEQPRDRLDALDRLLGPAFAASAGGGGGARGEGGKAVIDFSGGPTCQVKGPVAKLEADVRIKLRPEQESPQELTVTSEAFILEDARHSRGHDKADVINLDVFDGHGTKKIASGAAPSTTLKLYNDKWVTLAIRSAEYDADWLAELLVTVE